MSDETLLVRGYIRLLSTEGGGKASPIRGSYRPNHNFLGPDNHDMVIGVLDLPSEKELRPGEGMELVIAFLLWPGWKDMLIPGRQWRIQEGAKLIGIGTVIEVLSAE